MDIRLNVAVSLEVTNVEAESIRDILKYAEQESKNQISDQLHDQIHQVKEEMKKENDSFYKTRKDVERKQRELEQEIERLKAEMHRVNNKHFE